MITGMTALDILIVIAIFLPFIMLARVAQKNKRKLYKRFKEIAQTNGLNITEKEFWGSSYIGIDDKKKVLLFVRSEDGSFDERLVDLNKVRDCKVSTMVKNVKTKTTKQHILEKVDLRIYFTGSTAMETLDFYDHERVYSEDLEVKRAEKWKKMINENSVPEIARAMAS